MPGPHQITDGAARFLDLLSTAPAPACSSAVTTPPPPYAPPPYAPPPYAPPPDAGVPLAAVGAMPLTTYAAHVVVILVLTGPGGWLPDSDTTWLRLTVGR